MLSTWCPTCAPAFNASALKPHKTSGSPPASAHCDCCTTSCLRGSWTTKPSGQGVLAGVRGTARRSSDDHPLFGSFTGQPLLVVRTCVFYLASGSQNSGYLETSGDRAMHLSSVNAASRHLGYKSRSQLCKLMNDGWLDAHVYVQMPSGQRLLDVDGLQKTLHCS